MEIVITILEQKRGIGFYQSLIKEGPIFNFTTYLVCSTLQDTYATNLQEVLLYYPTVFIKSESQSFSDGHYKLQNMESCN